MYSYNESYEPMDIDMSGNSIKEMDISYGESTIVTHDNKSSAGITPSNTPTTRTSPVLKEPIIKKYHIVIRKSKRDKVYELKIMFCMAVIFLAILTYYVLDIKCNDNLDLKEFINTLSTDVFGQSKAITTIIETLKIEDGNKLLCFYGGTGVGKTFVSSLLLNTFGPYINVYHYTMPSFKAMFSTDFMLGLTLCKSSLIIVDDLTEQDLDVEEQIKEIFIKSISLKRNATVILIFNCHHSTKDVYQKCDESFQYRLMPKFDEIKALKKFVRFQPLTETHLRKCIEQELGDRILSEHEYLHTLKHFNVSVDGCKGVHSKIKYLNV